MVRLHLLAVIFLGVVAFANAQTTRQSGAAAANEIVLALFQIDVRAEREAFERAQIILIKSRPILKLALDRPGIAELERIRNTPDPIGWLERSLRVEFAPDGKTLRLALRGPDGPDLAGIVNAVTDAYLHHIVIDRSRTFRKLSDEHNARERKLYAALAKLAKAGADADRVEIELRKAFLAEARLHYATHDRKLMEEAMGPQIRLVQKASAAPR
jgi:hypothetical protein